MARYRKTLGEPQSPCAQELRSVMKREKKEAVCRWCIAFSMERLLPILKKHCPQDKRVEDTLKIALSYLNREASFGDVRKAILWQAHQAARELEAIPSAQAAARACAHAASSVHAVTHAMGILFYGAAAISYDRHGTNKPAKVYCEEAQELCEELLVSLRAYCEKQTKEEKERK